MEPRAWWPMGCCAKAHLHSKWAFSGVNNLLTSIGSHRLMARIANEKNANRRVRSFNLDDAHFWELKRLSGVQDCSMSDVLNMILGIELAHRKVARDVEKGLQTTLELHVQSAEIRAKRKDKKCNPNVLGQEKKCSICWGA